MKIKKGDTIKLLAGKDKGKTGKVMQVFPRDGKVVVEGVNQLTRHLKSQKAQQPGQKITFSAPLHVSNVALVCPQCQKSTRVGYRVSMNTANQREKTRVCKHCQQSVTV